MELDSIMHHRRDEEAKDGPRGGGSSVAIEAYYISIAQMNGYSSTTTTYGTYPRYLVFSIGCQAGLRNGVLENSQITC